MNDEMIVVVFILVALAIACIAAFGLGRFIGFTMLIVLCVVWPPLAFIAAAYFAVALITH